MLGSPAQFGLENSGHLPRRPDENIEKSVPDWIGIGETVDLAASQAMGPASVRLD
jgi:hypothetical protein